MTTNSLPNDLGTLSPGDPVWFVSAGGAVKEFVLLAFSPSEEFHHSRDWFVVGTRAEVRDPLNCYPTSAAALKRAAEDRRRAVEHAKALLQDHGCPIA